MESRTRARTTAGRFAVAAAVGLVLVLTLAPGSASTGERCSPLAIACGSTAALDFTLNLLLFVPVGAGLTRLGLAPRWAALIPTVLSLVVEGLQWLVVSGREPSVRDLLANGAGGALGAWLGLVAPGLAHPSPERSRRLLLVGSGALTMLLGLGGALVGSSFPAGTWYGQWTPELGGFDRFEGQIVEARLGDRLLPSGPQADSRERRALATREGLTLAATTIAAGRPSGRWAPIVSVFDDAQRKVAMLARNGDDLVFEPRTRAEDWGFQPLSIRMPGVFADAADTLEVSGRYRRGRLEVGFRWDRALARRSAHQSLAPVDAWRALVPRRLPLTGPIATAIGGAWLAVLFFPLGYWGGRAGAGPGIRRPVLLVALVALAPALVAVCPLPLGLPLAGWPNWLGVAIGWGLGWASAPGTRPLGTRKLVG
jgi:hypothetical protein